MAIGSAAITATVGLLPSTWRYPQKIESHFNGIAFWCELLRLDAIIKSESEPILGSDAIPMTKDQDG
jgi:hypothetical protein